MSIYGYYGYPSYSYYGYPSYGRYGSYGSGYRSRYNRYGYSNSSPYYSGYYYGNSRRRPYYWERDRNIYRNWRRNRNEREPTPREDTPSPPPAPPRPEPPEEEIVKVLHVKKVDLHVAANTQKHKTDDYECTKNDPPELVVRRGDTMKITITFDRPYSKEKNDMTLVFSIGEAPVPSKGTKAVIEVDESGSKKFKSDQWGATLQEKNGNDATILVHIPCNCIVGEWNFSVKTFSVYKDDDKKPLTFQYEHEEDITILFNPWCKDDEVYMEKESELEEYILNDNGCVHRGNSYQIGAKEWTFGQFETDILDISLHLIRNGFKGGVSKKMADPVVVSRVIAKQVNMAGGDADGVLVGNWSGDYDDGTAPTKWSGSVDILKQWKESGPVKYGQCWVFSCLTTTVCRAVGIPCRTVTNFSSAHDTNGTVCIEKFFDKDGNEIEEYNKDSVWNFHVWNEVWMSRPDLVNLKPGYEFLSKSGWQVIDATPQELSDGTHQCGPCPVKAIYKGYCSVKYDTPFVFAEVNSDIVHWTILPNDEYVVKEIKKKSVGTIILTKKPDGKPYKLPTYGIGGLNFNREAYDKTRTEDLTLTYKPKEGTKEERDAVEHALSTTENTWMFEHMNLSGGKRGDVEFHLLHNNNVMIGSDLEIKLSAKNNGNERMKIVFAKVSVAPSDYTGATGKAFFTKSFNVDDAMLKTNEGQVFSTVLKHEDYLPKVVEQAHFVIVATAKYGSIDNNSGETFDIRKEHTYRFRRPDLDVTCPARGTVGEKVVFEVSFKNPLDIPLTNCDISMETAGFEKLKDAKQPDVPAGGEYRRKIPLVAKRARRQANVTFSFDCAQIKDISGGNSIEISY